MKSQQMDIVGAMILAKNYWMVLGESGYIWGRRHEENTGRTVVELNDRYKTHKKIPNNLAIMEREENMGEGSAERSASANGAMTFQHPF